MEKRIRVTISLEKSVLENGKSAAATESLPFSTWLNREVKARQAEKRKQFVDSSLQPSVSS